MSVTSVVPCDETSNERSEIKLRASFRDSACECANKLVRASGWNPSIREERVRRQTRQRIRKLRAESPSERTRSIIAFEFGGPSGAVGFQNASSNRPRGTHSSSTAAVYPLLK